MRHLDPLELAYLDAHCKIMERWGVPMLLLGLVATVVIAVVGIVTLLTN